MGERKKLPPRRPALTSDVVWRRERGAHRFVVTIGFDPETGTAREVFASATRGSDMDLAIADYCVTLSHILQLGGDPRALLSSLLKVSDPSSGGSGEFHASVMGAIVEAVIEVADHG